MKKHLFITLFTTLTWLYMLPVIATDTLPQGIIKLSGQPAPPLHLQDMDGNSFNIKQARGTWIFVHFWASWCGPCRREMPTVQKLKELLGDTPLKIVLVNTAENEDTIFSFLSAVAPDMSTLMDRDGEITERWQPRGLPATYLVSPKGTLEYIALGGRNWADKNLLMFVKQLAATH